jgi:crotonobetainyl-CoA hydratase
MDAEEALRWGLANRVVPAQDLMDSATALARQVLGSAPLALGAIKEVLAATWHQSIPDGYATLRSGQLATYKAMIASDDAQEGPLAFSEKREPRWQGR